MFWNKRTPKNLLITTASGQQTIITRADAIVWNPETGGLEIYIGTMSFKTNKVSRDDWAAVRKTAENWRVAK